MGNLLTRMETRPQAVYAFDLSWSRIRYGQKFLKSQDIHNVQFFTGDMFHMPIKDNSIDFVYTVHAVEPDGGREREALIELNRIAKKYVVLLEPAYEFAVEKARERMLSHGYITNLYTTAIDLGYKVIEHRLFERSLNPLNPTGLIIIEKNPELREQSGTDPLCCPITKASLKQQGTAYYSNEGMLAYPVLEHVPCLLPQNAIVATHFNDFQ